MKQTAVEWLENKFKEELVLINSADGYHIFIRVEKFDELISKAKEIFKEQIMEAFIGHDLDTEENIEVAQQYYNETYKNTEL